MKKIIAILLTLVLSLSIIVPANADGEVYLVYDCELDEKIAADDWYYGRCYGPVKELEELKHPAPVQGEYSYLLNITTSSTSLYFDLPETFDATKYEYIELDIYANLDVMFNWTFGLCSDVSNVDGSVWSMQEVCIPGKTWVHFKMPISEFGGFSEAYPESSLDNINRIKIQFTNILDFDKLVDEGYPETPVYTYIYLDNIVATTGDAGGDNQLIDLDTIFEYGLPEWWPQDPWTPVPPDYPTPPEIVWGDADDDGRVDASDALTTLQHSVGKITLFGVPLEVADVDGNGEINAADALLVLQYSVGKIDAFPGEFIC